MTNDIEWTDELLQIAENKSYQSLIDWIGNILESIQDSNTHSTVVLKPNNIRISKVHININNSKLERIFIQGDKYFLPFDYLAGMTKEYKTTFNTYDAIDDEQFVFYPTKVSRSLIGIDSWIDKSLQSKKHNAVIFKNVSFYFDENTRPYHYRDGWLFVNT